MVVRVSDKKQTYNNVTKLLVKPFLFSINEIRLMISSYLIIFNSPNLNEVIVNISAY